MLQAVYVSSEGTIVTHTHYNYRQSVLLQVDDVAPKAKSAGKDLQKAAQSTADDVQKAAESASKEAGQTINAATDTIDLVSQQLHFTQVRLDCESPDTA